MAEFTYVAIDKNGKEVKGNITADRREMALSKLKNEGLTALELKDSTLMTREIDIAFGTLVKPRDLSVFCRQFVSMLGAGVTILDALRMLAEQTENKYLRKALEGVVSDIEKGETLHDAMGKRPRIFPDMMVSMVAAGESSGRLEVTFERMSIHFEKSAKVKSMIKKAAIYPSMVALISIVVMVVMLVVVIPRYIVMFEEMQLELPGITLFVINASNFLKSNGFILLAFLIALIFIIKTYNGTDSGKHFVGRLKANIPIYKRLELKSNASLYARTLSTLTYAGMPLIDSLGLTANTMTNILFKDEIKRSVEEIKAGVPLSKPLIDSKLFPAMVGHMVKIGEESGDLDNMLNKLAEYYDEEVEMETETVMAALEPVMILVMAGMVGFLIAACMAPMISMYNGFNI
ncbi:MAG: type II secretion system F family protein [Pseudobutyrivibrio sp.]|nr:type II secretion system F family protein [Pseudobutyrivibrio sp.]